RDFALLATGENGHHAMVVALGNRIELVIMAAGAAKRDSEKRFARRIDRVREPLISQLLAIQRCLMIGRPNRVQTGSDAGFQMAQFVFRNPESTGQVEVIRPKLVTGDLLL